MSEKVNDIFREYKDVFLGREKEIKDFLLKYKKDAFIKQDVLEIERIDATDRLITSGFRKNLSMWQNFYKNLIVSVCMEYKRKERRFDYKFYFTEEKLDSELLRKVEDIIKEANTLKARNKFEKALEKVNLVEELVSDTQDVYFNKQLKILSQEINSARENYREKMQKINTLRSELEALRKQQDYDKALKLSKEIINIAESIHERKIEKELEQKIKEIEREKIQKQIAELEEEIESTRELEKFKTAIKKSNQVIDLAESVELTEEKEKFIKIIEELKREKIKKEIRKLQQRVEKNRSSRRYHVAISNCEEIIELADTINEPEMKKNTNTLIKEIEKEIEEAEKKQEISKKIAALEKQLDENKANNEYEESLDIASELLVLANSIEDEELKKKYEIIKDELEIQLKEKKKEEEQKIIESEIKELEEDLKQQQQQNNLEKVISISQEIIDLSSKIKRDDIKTRYQQLITKTQRELEKRRKKKEEEELKDKKLSKIQEILDENAQKKIQEQENLLNEASKVEGMMEIDEDILPLIEEFSVDELIGDLSDDIDQMIEQLGVLLEDHRVEIKETIKSESTLISTSGEIIDLDNEIRVKKAEEEDETSFNVESGFENPFDDMIEEAIISDLIPYNFEISNVKLNGKQVENLPEKLLLEDGLEVKWELENIPPKESVHIKYDLRKRISRTIIFLLEDELKIFKTHSNIKQSKPKVEGLYYAKLPFTNPSKKALNGLVIEDIIPLYYIHNVREPTTYLPQENKVSQGSLVKWNIGTLEPKTIKYHYKLLELYKFEELKALIYKLDNEGFEALKKDESESALLKYNEIVDVLDDFIK
jgi:hypothetical protein